MAPGPSRQAVTQAGQGISLLGTQPAYVFPGVPGLPARPSEEYMLSWTATFFVLAVIGGFFLGLTGMAGAAQGMAPAWLVITAVVVGAVAGSFRGRPPL